MAKQSLLRFFQAPELTSTTSLFTQSRVESCALPATPRTLSVRQPSKESFAKVKAHVGGKTHAERTVRSILAGRADSIQGSLDEFLSPSLQHLPSPLRLRNFSAAAGAILDAIHSGSLIGIVGDYDVDGITAVAQTVSTLQASGTQHHTWIPNRFRDGYGISNSIADQIIAKGCSLVVLFDHGSHAHEQIQRLRAAGITVVAFDHHPVGDTLPDCLLVNPRQPGCGLGSEYPSASGLSFLLNRYLREQLGLSPPDASLAALGTIADMVPLTRANRVISRVGLNDMRRGFNTGINALAHRAQLMSSDLVSSDLGFILGPAINAAGRLGDASICVELLTTSDKAHADEIAEVLFEYNDQRKELQRNGTTDSYEQLAQTGALPPIIVSHREHNHPGVNGLVAQGLATRYARPAFVLSMNEDGTFTGSARSGHPDFDLTALLSEAKRLDTDHIILKCGGHAAAAGVTIAQNCLDAFRALLDRAHRSLGLATPNVVSVTADISHHLKDITPGFVQQVDTLLEPYGNGFSSPQYLLEHLIVTHVDEYPGGRRMVEVEQNGTRARIFIGPELWNADLQPGSTFSAVATPALVYRNQRKFVQFSIAGYRTIKPLPSEQGDNNAIPPERAPLAPDAFPPQVHHRTPTASQISQRAHQLSFALFDDEPLEGTTTSPQPAPSKPPRGSPKAGVNLDHLVKSLARTAQEFDSRYLYPELTAREPNPFNPHSPETVTRWWDELKMQYGLRFNTASVEYRPAAIEFIRYFFDNLSNHVLQAPTGAGKTEIALMISSWFHTKNRRVIFVAPSVDIVRQQSARVQSLLGFDPVIIDGETTPPERRLAIYDENPGCIVATPHCLANDAFVFRATDLLIVDEAHHATGSYPYVPLIKAARDAQATILALSATPAQVLPGESWEKLDALKELVGVRNIFPLNYPPHRPQLHAQRVQLTDEIIRAHSDLSQLMMTLQGEVVAELRALRREDVATQALAIFKPGNDTFPSMYDLNDLCSAVRSFTPSAWHIYRKLLAIGELSELRNCLVEQGICSFLLRCIEKRSEITLPPRLRAGTRMLAPPSSTQEVYSSDSVRKAYNQLARGNAANLWERHALLHALGVDLTTYRANSARERIKVFNSAVKRLKVAVINDLASADYEDHPREEYIVGEISRHGRRSFLSIQGREHAIFLAKRLAFRLKTDAVAFTGSGEGASLGITAREAKANLASYNGRLASIIVGTSKACEGIDLDADYGYCVTFDGSHTRSKQKQGRVGRRSFGRFDYLYTSGAEYGRILNIVRKDIAFQRMLNRERTAVLALQAATKRSLTPP